MMARARTLVGDDNPTLTKTKLMYTFESDIKSIINAPSCWILNMCDNVCHCLPYYPFVNDVRFLIIVPH